MQGERSPRSEGEQMSDDPHDGWSCDEINDELASWHERYNKLRADNAKLRAVVEDFLSSFPKHYQGFPGKLEWPEIHRLKQAIEGPKESP
jgi:hypothetical protein